MTDKPSTTEEMQRWLLNEGKERRYASEMQEPGSQAEKDDLEELGLILAISSRLTDYGALKVLHEQCVCCFHENDKLKAELAEARPLLDVLGKCNPKDLEWEAEGTDWLEKGGRAVQRFLNAALAYRAAKEK